MAHIHKGAAGVNGPIVVTLNTPDKNGTSTACADIDPALAKDILANPQGYYVNVHNADFPNGAARGQLKGHTGVGVTAPGADGKVKVIVFDTENPASATPTLTADTKGAPVDAIDYAPGTTTAYLLLTVGTVPTSPSDPTPSALLLQLATADTSGKVSTVGDPFQANLASAFGMDVNPVTGLIRVISNSGDNFRLDPKSGAKTSDTHCRARAWL